MSQTPSTSTSTSANQPAGSNVSGDFIQCPLCPQPRFFRGRKGLNIHNSRTHVKVSQPLASSCTTPPLHNNSNSASDNFPLWLGSQKQVTPVVKRIPRGARIAVGNALNQAIARVITENSYESWTQLLSFSFRILHTDSNNSISLTQKIKHNCQCPANPDFILPQPRIQTQIPNDSKLLRKVEHKIIDGDIKGAAQLLFSSDVVAPDNTDTVNALQTKHPLPAATLHLPDPPDPNTPHLTATKKDVLAAVMSFKNGSAGGLDGLSPQHLKDLLGNRSGDAGGPLLDNITQLINIMLSGKVCSDVLSILYGANLCALKKKDGGIRPIAVGFTFRRICSKICCRYARGRDSYRRMAVYDDIGDTCLLSMEKQVKSTTSSLWRQLSVCLELVRAREQLSRAHLDLQYLCSLDLDPNASQSKQSDPNAASQLSRHLDSGVEHLDALVQYLYADELEIEEVQGVIDYYKTSLRFNETSKMADIRSKGHIFTKESKACLDKLRRFQYGFRSIVRKSVQQEVWAARRTLGVGIAIFAIVLVVSPLLVLLLKNTISTMQSFSTSIATTTQRLMAEKQKSDILLSRMLPMPVLQRLRAQKTVPAEAFDAVTIFFSDIVGFTSISAKSTPMEIINMLNMLYRLFDEKITQYNVYKVETIGDAYMAVSGLPQRNGNRHASEIADMSLSLLRSLDGAMVPHCPGEALRIRAGINTGPCVAGVVGTSMPRYCLFGDTINTASRMESTGEAMKIHMSDTTKKALDVIGGYQVESRGITDIPGKGEMETFWLIGKMPGVQHESPRGPCLKDYDQDFLEMLMN